MLRALQEFVIEGPVTLLGFHRALLETPCFVEGGTCRGVVESEELAQRADELERSRKPASASADGASAQTTREHVVVVEVDGRRHEVRLHEEEPPWAQLARRHRERTRGLAVDGAGTVTSPMQGTVLSVAVSVGTPVAAGALICVVEAMKMENEIVSHGDGVVTELRVAPGDAVANGQVICVIAAE
jgi:acetyl-CoA/propionyl-CoA carboxylase biotin carboxyl carrier protein